MKSLIILYLLVLTNCTLYSQSDEVQLIRNYTDSIDNMLKNSDGLPGNVFCNTITMRSNKRAIGMQDTKISFYFYPKEDSIYEDENGLRFISLYNPPLKIQIEYNIAASQNVSLNYYFNFKGDPEFYKYKSAGEYGYEEKRFWFNLGIILKIEKYEQNDKKPVYEKSESFSKKDYEDAKNILFKSGLYINMYYKIFETEKLDK